MASPAVHLVDDDDSFLRAVARLLRASGFTVETYSSASELIARLPDAAPGCIVTDLCMPGINGLELQATVALRGDVLPVIFLTGNGDIPSTVRAMKGGAVDFLEKCAPKEKLLDAVRRALEGAERENGERAKQRKVQERFSTLTQRELEILSHVVGGRMNKEIAAELGIHERTVKLHRTAVTRKLGIQSVAELTRLWLDAGGDLTTRSQG